MRIMYPAIAVSAIALLAFSACKKGEESKKEPVSAAQPKDATEAPAATATTDAGAREQMQEHYETIREIERAIVSGDTATAREHAQRLADHTPSAAVAAHADEIESVKLAAATLAKEENLDALAHGAANLASLCGHCHLVTTKITSFEWVEVPEEGGSAADRMQRHMWAMDRLWEGLVGPSEMSWQEGSKVLAAAPFPVDQLPVDAAFHANAKAQLAAIAGMAKRASAATEAAERSKVYGELLGTCAGCHNSLP